MKEKKGKKEKERGDESLSTLAPPKEPAGGRFKHSNSINS